jgi:Protein of unknown function (DUF3467)
MAEQPEEEMTIIKEPQDISFSRSEHFTEIYANYVGIVSSPWDITLHLGRIVTDDPHHPSIEQRLSATLSPQTAKAMLQLLWRNIQAYEQQYGEIRYTPVQPQTEEPSA